MKVLQKTIVLFLWNIFAVVTGLYRLASKIHSQMEPGKQMTRDMCSQTYGFVRPQQKICRQNLPMMDSVLRGHHLAINECRYQFSKHRWNCTGHTTEIKSSRKKRTKTYMDRLLNKGTPEAAYVLAVTSAGVAHAVTKACSRGDHNMCGCDRTVYDIPKHEHVNVNISGPSQFKWSGCSDNIHFGSAFSGQFLDVRQRKRIRRNIKLGMVNLHNNHMGRTTVERQMKVECKCHGVSGSCELRTCWRALPKFRKVGDFLRDRFHKSVLVVYERNRLVPKYKTMDRGIGDADLLYLAPSPSFCDNNPRVGSLGTRGRFCNASSTQSADSCEKLCCQRGHTTRNFIQEENCECKFVWCCEVRCKTCRKQVVVSTCN